MNTYIYDYLCKNDLIAIAITWSVNNSKIFKAKIIQIVLQRERHLLHAWSSQKRHLRKMKMSMMECSLKAISTRAALAPSLAIFDPKLSICFFCVRNNPNRR